MLSNGVEYSNAVECMVSSSPMQLNAGMVSNCMNAVEWCRMVD